MTTETHGVTSYRTYWLAWGGLLGVTILMVYLSEPWIIFSGIVIKAAVIVLVFMHLAKERTDFMLTVILGILLTSLALFVLIIPDGMAM